jgi:Na+-translocating ferredoxin:NAD+ oxidoreductase RnfG subunit
MNGRRRHHATIGLFLMLLLPAGIGAEVYHSRESALRLAFPEADNIKKREIFLDAEEKAEVEHRARVDLPSRLVTVYIGMLRQRVVGYAVIETHKVRSLPETILVVVDPDGRTRAVHMLAFHEPPEYAPADHWLRQFTGRPLDDDLRLGTGVDGITGATMTANSIVAAVRRILAVLEIAVDDPAGGGSSTGPSSVVSDERE